MWLRLTEKGQKGMVADWRLCIFSEVAMRYTKTPLFAINSQYNFGEWEILAPTWLDTTAPPPDWADCWPGTGKLTVDDLQAIAKYLSSLPPLDSAR